MANALIRIKEYSLLGEYEMIKGKVNDRIEEEKRTVEQMIRLYCRHKEGHCDLCPSCREVLVYAHERLSKCPYKATKKSCRLCTAHCYRPEMRQRIREVMRYAGPRMLWYHPWSALHHLWREFSGVRFW